MLLRILFGLSLLFTTVLAQNQSVYAARVNDFEIVDYQIDYVLGRDENNRSTLKTLEIITAEFPSYDQNHGIERSIPKKYNDHSTRLKILSVTDGGNSKLEYTTYDSNDNVVVRIGNADTYVHGLQTYKISYEQHDVTQSVFDDTQEEFYWDTSGTDWRVPIAKLTVHLRLDPSLRTMLSDKNACYQGANSSTERCKLDETLDGYVVSAHSLAPGENVSVAIGFKSGTFVEYEPTVLDRVNIWRQWVEYPAIGAAIAGALLLTWYFYRVNGRRGEMGTIVAEYTPPKSVSVLAAGVICRKETTSLTAQILDFAVKGYLKIYETRKKSLFRKAEYELEIVKDTSGLSVEEQEIIKDFFITQTVGTRFKLNELSKPALASLMADNDHILSTQVDTCYALRVLKDPVAKAKLRKWVPLFVVIGVLTISLWPLAVAVYALVLSWVVKPLSDKGLALARYLKGLEMYISIAEKDRIAMLQSPDGAMKLGAAVDPNDERKMIQLYESVLPYAVLFGQEKKWNQQLGKLYQSSSTVPLWFAGSSGSFNAGSFSSSLSSFATSTSSSSGSSGGGSSGGGGGGGGGSGW